MRVGVVVLAFEPGDVILETIAAIEASQRPADSVLVVDNASSTEGLAALTATYPSVRVRRRAGNDGYGAAMNDGAEELVARGCDRLLFVTQETVLARDAIGALEAALDESKPGVVGPLLCRRSSRDLTWSSGGRLTAVRRAPRHLDSGRSRASVPKRAKTVTWLDGACLYMSADTFASLKGFRTDLFLYLEDVDLCRRIRGVNGRVICATAATAWQEPSMTPPYLAARNRALVLGRLGVTIDVMLHAVFDPIRGRPRRFAQLSRRGLRDARTGRLDWSVAMERP